MAEPPASGLEAHLAAVKERARKRLVDRAARLEEAADRVEANDADGVDAVLRLAHKLRGIGGSIGREDLTERAGRLEDAIRANAGSVAVAEGARRLARLCRDSPSAVAAPPPSRSARGSRPAPRALGWRVLVIDDAAATRQLLSLTLRAAGCEVESTEDPERFMDHVRERRPDLAIVDAMMPGTDGLTLHGTVRRLDGPPVPVVILSAASPSDLGWVLPDDPQLRWMRKPFRGRALLEALSRFVADCAP